MQRFEAEITSANAAESSPAVTERFYAATPFVRAIVIAVLARTTAAPSSDRIPIR